MCGATSFLEVSLVLCIWTISSGFQTDTSDGVQFALVFFPPSIVLISPISKKKKNQKRLIPVQKRERNKNVDFK